MGFSEYARFDGLGLAALVAKKEVTPLELTEEAIARIEKHNGTLNAVIYKMYDIARERAKQLQAGEGAFRGVPFLLKDILGDHAGVPTAQGCRFMANSPAAMDSTLVSRYRDAGFVFLGKTNVPEFGLVPTTESKIYGPACNPWNPAHSTGGSSGGSAAAVAAGIVPVAHANDGGGSIRIPASCCGLVGLKPTRGRNPLGPALGDVLGGMIAEHVVSRTVRDSAAVLDCTHGPEIGDPYCAPAYSGSYLQEVGTAPGKLRIAFATKTFEGKPLHEECTRAILDTAKLCEDLGHVVEEASPTISVEMMTEAFLVAWCAGLAMNIDAYAMIHGKTPTEDQFEGLTWGLYQQGKEIPASRYLIAVAMMQILSRQVAHFHTTYDVFLTATLSTPPMRNGVANFEERDPALSFAPFIDYVPFTPLGNATGQPSISLPLHSTPDGLPVGLLFQAACGNEALLYRLAGQLEEAKPWIDRKPPVWD